MKLNGVDLVVALDYLKHEQKVVDIDRHVGYKDGTLNDLVNKLQNSFGQIELKTQEKEESFDNKPN